MMPSEQDLHAVLVSLAVAAVSLLKQHGFFQTGLVPETFWKPFRAISTAKNERAYDIAFKTYSQPAIERASLKITIMIGRAKFEPAVEAKVSQTYFEGRKDEFVRLMTRTDLTRFEAMTEPEALKLFKLIEENGGVNEAEFTQLLKDADFCDADFARLNNIRREETHDAENSAAFKFAKEAGCEEKFRQTMEDGLVRDEHAEDSDAGWIPIDEAYPYSGEMVSGDDSFGCRCDDLYRFKPAEETAEA